MTLSTDGIRVCVQTEDFDLAAEVRRVRALSSSIGALASFQGIVSDFNDGGGVQGLFLEHYPGMTERVLEDIAQQAASRWDLLGQTIIHRVGSLAPSDNIVLVIVASRHRQDAFMACEFLMDILKTQAPFWKKERRGEQSNWVESRASDEQARQRWQRQQPSSPPRGAAGAEGD